MLRSGVTVMMAASLIGGFEAVTAAPAMANPTVTGTVVDSGGTPQPDVVVDVLNAGSTNVVTSTVTHDPDGTFQVTVPSGTYDFRFTPPETSGLRVYLATGINADTTAPLTVILKPVTVIHVEGVFGNSQGGGYGSGYVNFRLSGGPTTQRNTNSSGQYSADLLSGQYYLLAYGNLPVSNGLLRGFASFSTPVELDQSQTYNITIPTKTLTVSVRDIGGASVTDAGVRFDDATVNTPTVYYSTYPDRPLHVDTNGNLVLPIPAGATFHNPAIVLDSGLVIPFTIPTMTTDRHLYLIFDRVTGGLFLDERPPIVTGVADRAANASGWYNAPVTVSWSSVDPAPSSGVPMIPEPTVVSTEGADQVLTSAESCDPAGNCAAGHYTLSIDRTAPTISYTTTPAANGHGWHNSAVTVSFTCADALSGVASCPGPVTVDAEGAGQTVTGTAVDNAGNTASVAATVNLDTTAPAITAGLSQTPTGGGWNDGDVTVTFTCADALSGVDSCAPPVTLTEDGPDQVVTGTAVDKAGNTAEVTVTVSIDKTKPLITAVRTPANDHGWNNGDVTVTFTCADAQSGIATCTALVTVTGEGASQSVTGTAVNNAGSTAVTTVDDINIDKTPPVITAEVVGSPNSAGWYRSAPTVHFTCTDTLSGIDTCPGDVVVAGDGANQSVTGTAVDNAGNTAEFTVTGLNVDLTAPVVSVVGALNGGTYPLDQIPTISCTTTDATSRVATQASPTVSRDAAGLHTATCAGGMDLAGNTADPVSISYTVTPTATSLGDLTGGYVSGSGSPNATGVIQDLQNKLMHGQICQYISKVSREAEEPNPTLTAAQAAELIYWARIMDPTC
ncbi:MAG TPA: hypothetical protein VFB74_21005 [Kribbellaceae bacterium]|nr:hypothetical protein [Kribbellaceae bacterium]